MGVNFPLEIPEIAIEPQIEIKFWRMETRPDKEKYLEAREVAFGYPLQTVEILEHFSGSEVWQNGTMSTAFVEGEIVGSCMALGDGILDYVFVVPKWRGRGIAKKVVAEGLRFLQEREHKHAWLEVYSHNDAAIRLYQSFGFETFKEEVSLGLLID
jgi:ribosomal protein S18 acetylase RimI-like enzyme